MSENEIKYLIYVFPSILVVIGFGLFLLLKRDNKKA